MLNLACVFPGQGSQSVGMLLELAENFTEIIDVFTQVSDRLGYDLWNLVQNGPQELLDTTEYTQVAVLAADVAVFRVLRQHGIKMPQVMAGHSLGEYAALVCAQALSLSDAAILVSQRGKIMQEHVPIGVGSMAAIVGLTDDVVVKICLEASVDNQEVTPANFNAIGQIVIAGHTPAVVRALVLAEAQAAYLAKIIAVSVPCHCALLHNASAVFAEFLEQISFKIPVTAVISNVDLSVYKTPTQIKTLLTKQLYSPVRWVETIQMIPKNYNIDLIIECGPGKVLAGLIKRIDKSISVLSINDKISLIQAQSHIIKEEV